MAASFERVSDLMKPIFHQDGNITFGDGKIVAKYEMAGNGGWLVSTYNPPIYGFDSESSQCGFIFRGTTRKEASEKVQEWFSKEVNHVQ